eukprot:CAMPEP_0184018518 /NCGR_PEP_ID=MMETSP0954-20121128/8192_1 /TAXON_ID=627963 /ORGANISM="Aplanochytrium sp, Strain PBS07" /LENGTH=111 /DNA_ID=CAMNT_0026299985 /DNA_START=338 /DNA_END=673 /DNA_ORIENTATION=-
MVGYTGGNTLWPNYASIKDHTEAVRIEFDPDLVSYKSILDNVFQMAEPFHKESMIQYQSAVWWLNQEQKLEIEKKVEEVENSSNQKVKMLLAPVKKFYRAEEYHQKYYSKH